MMHFQELLLFLSKQYEFWLDVCRLLRSIRIFRPVMLDRCLRVDQIEPRPVYLLCCLWILDMLTMTVQPELLWRLASA